MLEARVPLVLTRRSCGPLGVPRGQAVPRVTWDLRLPFVTVTRPGLWLELVPAFLELDFLELDFLEVDLPFAEVHGVLLLPALR